MHYIVKVKAADSEYDIHVEDGAISKADVYLSQYSGRKAAIVTDTNVSGLYLNELVGALNRINIDPFVIEIEPGEQSKCNDTLMRLYSEFIEASITRSDCIIALGGGVVGDLTGYAGATFLRGVDVIQIPTTLLAQVDSSVGGKVAINLPQGKNLVGVFSQPKLVLCDTNALNTLSQRQMGAGLGEVVKYGCIFDSDLFEMLEESENREALLNNLPWIVKRCCEIKGDYVHRDPFDNGARKELNFGHTLGHALEQTMGYGELLHGEAVCIGMVEASKWSEDMGVAKKGIASRVENLLDKLDLPTSVPQANIDSVNQAMMVDKKGRGDKLDLVLLEKIGKACLKTVAKSELNRLI